MSLAVKRFYEFEDFHVDLNEKILFCKNHPVPVTPKVFDTLQILIENAGRILGKDELMQEIWQERIVEESNLTFNIKMLRKALGDCATKPHFIETVPRRGYRFIAKVRQVSEEFDLKSRELPPGSLVSADDSAFPKPSKNEKTKLPLAALTLLFIGLLAAAALVYLLSDNSKADSVLFAAQFSVEKLSNTGKVFHVVLSPDGKNVFYTNGIKDKQSVWLRQLESGTNVEILPPSDDNYAGLALSPDGNFLYFSRRPKNFDGQADIFRVSIFGGVPGKIAGETQGWIGVSPDGAKISFVRCYNREDEGCALWIADAADGKNERKLVSRPRPFRIGDNEFSPDGRSIAFAAGQSENQANEFSLMEVDIESGRERALSAEKFFDIRNLAWLPGKSGLIITASKMPVRNFRIWQISPVSGEIIPLTKDSETYSSLSLDKKAELLAATQFKSDFRLQVFQTENPGIKRVLTDAESATFAANDKIVFSSEMFGNMEIWSIEPDGSRQRQLTNNISDESKPIVSPDQSSIFFASNRTGEVHVWQMSEDGSNQRQVTRTDGGFPVFISPDGNRLYYQHGRNRTLWSVSVKGGDERLVLDKSKYDFGFSRDGQKLAFSEKRGESRLLTIVSMNDFRILKTFETAVEKGKILEIEWLPDSKSLLYILTDGAYENNTLWHQRLDREQPEKIADFGDEEMSDSSGFAVSPDGKSFIICQGGWKHDAVLIKGLR